MTQKVGRIIVIILAVVLLIGPLLTRTYMLGYTQRGYAPTPLPSLSLATTPVPTNTPVASIQRATVSDAELRPGPVIVDLAHGNRLARSQFEPLSAVLANRGLGLRFWLTSIDPLSISNFMDYPDQSEDLAELLADASALVVASPFFLWSPAEISQVERFVADGGRLLLISDPDVVGDLAQDINNLAEPFGVVFADDYLYDTQANDGNFVYVFQGEYLDQAAALAGSTIALYGARSIGGDVTPQLRTGDTALSNLRTGLTNLTTAAIGGLTTRGTHGNVLALGDFDVLTMPFVERHDNRRLVEFAADFLAAAQRNDTVTDFPAYLGKEVSLVFGNASAVDAQILLEGSKLQAALEATGRVLSLSGTTVLTATLAGDGAQPGQDLIVLADYGMADAQTPLLADLGLELVEVNATPTPEAEPATADEEEPAVTPTTTPGREDAQDDQKQTPAASTPIPTLKATLTPTVTATATRGPEARANMPASLRSAIIQVTPTLTATHGATPTVQATPHAAGAPTATFTPTLVPTMLPSVTPTATPATVVYLQTADGLRLVAADTVIIAQRQLADGHRLVAVLGNNSDGIRSGVDRLLKSAYEGCVTEADVAICAYAGGSWGSNATPTPAAHATAVPAMLPVPGVTPMPGTTPPPDFTVTPTASTTPDAQEAAILLIDDNDAVGAEEVSEVDIYLQALVGIGQQPTLWKTVDDGIPSADTLKQYRWVIWSSAGYESGGPSLADLDPLFAYINAGGHLTISSRHPFFGMSTEAPSVIADVALDSEVPELVLGMPSMGFPLESGLPPVTPLEISPESDNPKVALRRGSESGNPGAPILFMVSDTGDPDATGAQLMILGMSLTWFPDDYGKQLVRNMSTVMLRP